MVGLGLWWTCWLVYLVGNRVAAGVAESNDASTLERLPLFEAVVAVAVVVGCVQWCRLVMAITEAQGEMLTQR